MIRRSAATAAAACTSSSGFVRTLARGRGRGPRGAAGRRREPRHALPQPPQPPPAEASPAAEATWATPINASDKRWAWASLVFGGLAIGGLTLNKWEIEKRLEGYVKKPPERLRPIRPPARPSSARSSSGRPPASASLGQLADMFTALFSTQAQGAAARAGGAVEVRRVRGGRQSSASSTEAGDLSPQCQYMVFALTVPRVACTIFRDGEAVHCLPLTQRRLSTATRVRSL